MKIECKKDGIEVDGIFLTLADITNKCNDVKLKENNLVLLKMHWAGRSGDVL